MTDLANVTLSLAEKLSSFPAGCPELCSSLLLLLCANWWQGREQNRILHLATAPDIQIYPFLYIALDVQRPQWMSQAVINMALQGHPAWWKELVMLCKGGKLRPMLEK